MNSKQYVSNKINNYRVELHISIQHQSQPNILAFISKCR